MKRLALMAAGLTGLLASCGGVIVQPVVQPVRVTQVTEFTTQFIAQANYTDTQGNRVITAGESIICNNVQNIVRVKFDWSGDLGSASTRLRGLTTGEVTNVATFQYPRDFTADGAIEATLGAGVAPRSVGGGLSAQAITVTPRNIASVLGYSYLEMQVFDQAGRQGTIEGGVNGNTFQSVTALPIVNCS